MARFKRAVGLVAATAMAGAIPLLAASPAQATFTDCTNYMRNMGYIVGQGVQSACGHGESGFVGEQVCFTALLQLGVPYDHAQTACYQAARD